MICPLCLLTDFLLSLSFPEIILTLWGNKRSRSQFSAIAISFCTSFFCFAKSEKLAESITSGETCAEHLIINVGGELLWLAADSGPRSDSVRNTGECYVDVAC